MDDVDVDVVAVAQADEAFREIGEGGVDRATDQEFRPGRARRAADDVDDAAMRRLQERPEQPRHAHRAEELEREAVGPCLVGKRQEIAAARRARIVDEHVAAAEARVDLGMDLLAALERTQIGGDRHRRRPAGRGDDFRAFGQIGRVRCRQHRLRALAREGRSDGAADAAAAAGDDDDLAGEFVCHAMPPALQCATYTRRALASRVGLPTALT